MRVFSKIFLGLFLIFVFAAQVVFAQEMPLSDYKPSSEATAETPQEEAEQPAEESPDENIFSIASDEQIKEAQKFYKYCSRNESMSKQKDCKCAATAYLETRLELGEDATPEDIIEKNIDVCLKQEKVEVGQPFAEELSELTDDQIEEAQEVYEYCKADQKLSRAFDCECFAARFLDERLSAGPTLYWDALFLRFKDECKNIVETTGYEYTQCMGMYAKEAPIGIEPVEYCECYARLWATLYENHTGSVTPFAKNNIRLRAMQSCKRPENYEP